MFYYEKYNIFIMSIFFVLSFCALIFLLRKKIYSVIDPLLFNIIWCSSGMSLMIGYFFAKGISLDGSIFVLVYLIYITGLYFFLDKTSREIGSLDRELNSSKNILAFFVCVMLNIVSRYEFITYAISNPSIASWFLYRFKQWEGRSFIQYILQLGARPFFIYYLFILIKTRKKWRFSLVCILISNSVLDILAGGRSSLLGLLEAYGYFICYFYPYYNVKSIKRLNWYGVTALVVVILNSIVVTSFYGSEGTIEDSALRMANRVLAAGDGLEMYLANNAPAHINFGIVEYLKATFGIFIKRVVNVDTQSMGWQLYELDKGYSSPIAVGPNFILPLQVIMFGKVFLLPYTLMITFITAFLRGNKLSRKYIRSQPLSFVFGLLTFQLVVDAEFFVLQLAACLLTYYIFIFPIRKFTLIFD